MKNHCTTKKLLGGFCCIAIVTILGLLIAYCARLGFGDEIHTQATLGSCRESTTGAGAVKIMSFNTFLIPCIPTAKCQEDDAKEARVAEIGAWFKDREEDIILLQELWSFHDEIRDGMTSAGYCHYVITDRINGSGLAIFSKHPIETSDFMDWFDAFGIGDGMAPDIGNVEAYIADKGVLYAKIIKDDHPIHVFNQHANSDTSGDYHDVRVKQFTKTREYVDSKEIPSTDLVLLGGDFNEDKDCRVNSCEEGGNCEGQTYYDEMMGILAAVEPQSISNTTYTYDTEMNSFLKGLYEGDECDLYRYSLDYIFYSETHDIPLTSSTCGVVIPDVTLADHFPVSCNFDISSATVIREEDGDITD